MWLACFLTVHAHGFRLAFSRLVCLSSPSFACSLLPLSLRLLLYTTTRPLPLSPDRRPSIYLTLYVKDAAQHLVVEAAQLLAALVEGGGHELALLLLQSQQGLLHGGGEDEARHVDGPRLPDAVHAVDGLLGYRMALK